MNNSGNVKLSPEELFKYENNYLIATEPLLNKKYTEEYIIEEE